MADLIDPTVAGKYPVILGDGLLGKDANEVFTRIRYNHQPTLSSEDAPEQAKLKPSIAGKTSSYDLSYTDRGNSYAFQGARKSDDDQYVLYFDPARKAFILDKVDSTFDMNVTRLPDNSNAEDLSHQFPHLDISSNTKSNASRPKADKPKAAVVNKPVKKAKEVAAMAFPSTTESKPKPKPKPKSKNDEEEDEDDDDGGLLVEYPGADNSKKTDFSPAFPTQLRFDDYMDRRESEADDADGESDDEIDMEFKLPSPVNRQETPVAQATEVQEEEEDDDDADLEADLENELENAFEDLANSQEDTHAGGGDESEISEED